MKGSIDARHRAVPTSHRAAPDYVWGWRIALLAVILALVAGMWVSLPPTAHGSTNIGSTNGCRQAWGTDQERECRRAGWVLLPHLTVSPDRRAWTDLPPCPSDESVGRCYWNARQHGDRHGYSFVSLGRFGVFTGLHAINGDPS